MEVSIKTYFSSCKKLLDYLGITSDGDTLIEVIEVVVVLCISDGKSSDNVRRELSA